MIITAGKANEYSVREATQNDYEQLHQVRVAVLENRLSDPNRITMEDYTLYLHQRGKGWICFDHDKAVGFAIADLQGSSIWALFVLPGYEGKGIGRALQSLMLQWYFSQGKEEVQLTTSRATRAATFYQKTGWQQCGMVRDEILFTLSK